MAWFFTPLGMFIAIPIQMARIHRVEHRLQSPEVYLAVATNLALYCQSVDELHLTNTLGSSRLPQPLPGLGSPDGTFYSNYAIVEFGGGFYHYGYRLRLDEVNSNSKSNVWELSLCREGSPAKLLHHFTLPPTSKLSAALFTSNSLVEYDRRLAKSPSDITLHQGKIALLLKYDRSRARPACVDAVKALPNHWWPRLTLGLLDVGQGRLTEDPADLMKFVEAKPSCSRYLCLAYFYQALEKPDEAAKAVEKAVGCPIIDLEDDETNTECRGYSAAVYAFRSGKYSTAIKLCSALLPVRENGDYAKRALLDLKSSAEKAMDGGKPDFTPDERVFRPNPYERIDVRALLSP